MKKSFIILTIFYSICTIGQENELVNKLNGTVWINYLFENCTDTLKVTSESEMTFYSCEHDRISKANYFMKSDTIFVDLFDYVDNVNIGLRSKYKMKLNKDKLKYIFISHLYGYDYKEIDQKYYETAGEFKRIK